jgi:hypothetical protein
VKKKKQKRADIFLSIDITDSQELKTLWGKRRNCDPIFCKTANVCATAENHGILSVKKVKHGTLLSRIIVCANTDYAVR